MGKITGVMAGILVLSSEKVLFDHGFVCEDGIITDIEPNSKLIGKEGIEDHRENIVCPSFTNTHTHMYETIAHGTYAPNLSLKPLLEEFWWPCAEDRQTIETIAVTSKYACLEHLKTGITLINDILEAPLATVGERLNTEADIILKAGMKAVLSLESSERISTENGIANLNENKEFILSLREKGIKDVKGTICTHTTFSCSVPFLRTAAGMAREVDEMLQIHMNEGPDEEKCCFDKYNLTTAELYRKIGFWAPELRLWANQCSCLDPIDLQIMKDMKVGVSTQPRSNAICSAGIAPVREMLDHGLNVGLGTDNGHGNFFEEMRYLGVMQKGKLYNSEAITSKDAFKMATEMGATGLGFTNVGVIKKGNSADYIVMNANSNIYLKESNVLDEIFWKKEPTDIISVYVNGNLVYHNGKSVNLDDEQIYKEYKELNRDFWKGQPYQD